MIMGFSASQKLVRSGSCSAELCVLAAVPRSSCSSVTVMQTVASALKNSLPVLAFEAELHKYCARWSIFGNAFRLQFDLHLSTAPLSLWLQRSITSLWVFESVSALAGALTFLLMQVQTLCLSNKGLVIGCVKISMGKPFWPLEHSSVCVCVWVAESEFGHSTWTL